MESNSTPDNNPFQAPQALVADAVAAASGEFIAEGQRVDAGNGVAWLLRGWEMFKQAPGAWIGLSVVYLIIMIVLSLIPILGALALNLLMPVFIGGIMLGCKALDNGEELSISHLFAGFSNNAGNLVLIGVIYLVGVIAVSIVVFAVAAVMGIGAAAAGAGNLAFIPMLIAALFAMLLIIPLAMAVWFAPALVIFHEVAPFEAMKASFFTSIKNFVPFLIYGLVFFVLAIIASIPLFLGWLVLIPVMMASMYAGYRDMFVRT